MIRGLVKLFEVGGSDKLNEDWSVFGFIYGTIPAAPAVVIYASAFGIQEDMVNTLFLHSNIQFRWESFLFASKTSTLFSKDSHGRICVRIYHYI